MSSSNIVIVGGGTGGFLLFRQLATKLANSSHNLIIVEPRKFYVHQPSTLRMVVSPVDGYENKSIMNHPEDLSSGNVRFVYAKATAIVDNGSDGGRVTLDNDESIDYSVLILATGSRWSGPISFGTEKEEILETVTSWRAKFEQAQDIVLVGGGAIGFGKLPL
jgi:NADH dehydrogenase FAD-containing subunit